jgi:hypothetical protein
VMTAMSFETGQRTIVAAGTCNYTGGSAADCGDVARACGHGQADRGPGAHCTVRSRAGAPA